MNSLLQVRASSDAVGRMGAEVVAVARSGSGGARLDRERKRRREHGRLKPAQRPAEAVLDNASTLRPERDADSLLTPAVWDKRPGRVSAQAGIPLPGQRVRCV